MGEDSKMAPAIVCRGIGGWKVEDVLVDTKLEAMEVLIDVVAAGLCHTDLFFASMATEASGLVLGHEGKLISLFDVVTFTSITNICTIPGSGYVRAIGSEVQDLSPGDPVLLSFASCTECQPCTTGHSAFCDHFNEINFSMRRLPAMTTPFSTSESTPVPLGGLYFGQSSFARLTVAKRSSVVKVAGLISAEELPKYAPFGCGFQTGAGAVVNIAKAEPHDTIAVYGCGGVGLAAIMVCAPQSSWTVFGNFTLSALLLIPPLTLGDTGGESGWLPTDHSH